MAQGGYIGQGMKAGFSLSTSPGVWQKLEQVEDIQPPNLTSDKIDTTVSAATLFKSNIPGMFNVADTKVKMLRDDNPSTSPNQNYLWSLIQNRATILFRVEFHSDPDLTVNAYEAFEMTARVADTMTTATLAGKTELEATILFTNAGIGGSGSGYWEHFNHTTSVLG